MTQIQKAKNFISIPTCYDSAPIEISIIGKFPKGSGRMFTVSALKQQSKHPQFIDEYNEPSALIGKPYFSKNHLSLDDPSALYTFGIDTRDLVFHRHAGQRTIIGVTGEAGCLLKFSLCTPEEARLRAETFLEKMMIIKIKGNRMFTLRFNGMVYHQFNPVDYSENGFFAMSVHTNELVGLSGVLLKKVREGQTSIALLTEPAPSKVLSLLAQQKEYLSSQIQYMG